MFEVVIDNAKIQVHCNVEAPPSSSDWTIFDLAEATALTSDGIPTAEYVDGGWAGNLVTDPEALDPANANIYFDGFRLSDYSDTLYEFQFTFAVAHQTEFASIWRRENDDDTPALLIHRLDQVDPSDMDFDTGLGTMAIMQAGPDDLVTSHSTSFYSATAWASANTAANYALLFVFGSSASLTELKWRIL